MATSPTQLSLNHCRRHGADVVQVVERWNPHARRRVDLFGCIDIVACVPGLGILGVQATSWDNVSGRLTKSRATPQLRQWLACGGVFEVWGWGKAPGRRTYRLRRERLTIDDLDEPVTD